MKADSDGRWIADIPALPGAMVYGKTRKQALTAVEALALPIIADRLDHGEAVPVRRCHYGAEGAISAQRSA